MVLKRTGVKKKKHVDLLLAAPLLSLLPLSSPFRELPELQRALLPLRLWATRAAALWASSAIFPDIFRAAG